MPRMVPGAEQVGAVQCRREIRYVAYEPVSEGWRGRRRGAEGPQCADEAGAAAPELLCNAGAERFGDDVAGVDAEFAQHVVDERSEPGNARVKSPGNGGTRGTLSMSRQIDADQWRRFALCQQPALHRRGRASRAVQREQGLAGAREA